MNSSSILTYSIILALGQMFGPELGPPTEFGPATIHGDGGSVPFLPPGPPLPLIPPYPFQMPPPDVAAFVPPPVAPPGSATGGRGSAGPLPDRIGYWYGAHPPYVYQRYVFYPNWDRPIRAAIGLTPEGTFGQNVFQGATPAYWRNVGK